MCQLDQSTFPGLYKSSSSTSDDWGEKTFVAFKQRELDSHLFRFPSFLPWLSYEAGELCVCSKTVNVISNIEIPHEGPTSTGKLWPFQTSLWKTVLNRYIKRQQSHNQLFFLCVFLFYVRASNLNQTSSNLSWSWDALFVPSDSRCFPAFS